ncbi:Glycoside hydrolase family 28 [Lasiodiplodia theobromae]|uniref:galacturonan 1,4-alpha-galacturonidase n=1 Tax=Lasiodiplodia theobromae TaxID=45133 RepID=A0A8H7IQE9_9PEZI|nr:Glycoside hydrolase family 28 [Lasiodiplodia theobromae]
MVSSTRSSTALAVLALYASSTWAATVSEVFLASIRSARPSTAENSPARTRTCVVDSHNDGSTDDAEYIAAALQDCNNGGHVVFPSTQSYVINSPLDMTGLARIDIDIQGRIAFTDDIPHWLNNSFDLGFQNATSFFKLGGEDVNVYGGGTIDGQGQAWWDHYPKNKHDRRPVLFATVEMHGGSVSDLSLVNSPFWHNFVGNSSDVVFTDIRIHSVSNNENFEKNTDGWDIYRSDHITVQNSSVTNGDGA